MSDKIQLDYLNKEKHSQDSKRIIADYINEGFIRAGWLAKKINDLKLPGVKGITYRVKSDFSIGVKVRLDRLEWRKLPDFIGLSIIAPKSTFEYLPKALENISDLDHVSSSCPAYTLNCRFQDYPVEIALLDYKDFALKQFDECVNRILGEHKPVKLDFPASLLLETLNKLDKLYGSDDEKDKKDEYVEAFEKFINLGCIRKGFGRFSIAFPSKGSEKPVSVSFEDGFECDSAFTLAFLTSNDYPRLLRFGILSKDKDLHDLAFMAYKGVKNGTHMSDIMSMFNNFQY
ncbi:MAG: hypothetical protein J6S67_00705 [Methanobrevibacter sp.]|nr:hypothetical protein [Methanobrevibacter sp.]